MRLVRLSMYCATLTVHAAPRYEILIAKEHERMGNRQRRGGAGLDFVCLSPDRFSATVGMSCQPCWSASPPTLPKGGWRS